MDQHASFRAHQEVLLVVKVADIQAIRLGRDCHVYYLREALPDSHQFHILLGVAVRDDMLILYVNTLVVAPDIKLLNELTVLLIELDLHSYQCHSLESNNRPASDHCSTGDTLALEVYNVDRGSVLKHLGQGEVYVCLLEGIFSRDFLGDTG